jgi:hypothetical protein
MHSRKSQQDAFERALRETFGRLTSREKVNQARKLYARYRTDDILKRLKSVVANKNNGGGAPPP